MFLAKVNNDSVVAHTQAGLNGTIHLLQVGLTTQAALFTLASNPYFRKFKFVRVCSLVGRYFYNICTVKKFEIVFTFNVKDNNICPCLHNIRLL